MLYAFEIFRLNEEWIKKHVPAPPKPHRHDYEELIILSKGSPQHFIDFKKEIITTPAVVYIAMGKVHQFIPYVGTEGWVVRYKNEFIPETRFHFYSNFTDNINYKIGSADCLQRIDTLCGMMLHEFLQQPPDFNIIRPLLAALLAKLESEERKDVSIVNDQRNPQLTTFNSFLKILEANYKRAEGVQFYAEKLNMSVRNLNLICQAIFNKSVSEIVETRKLIEARQLLTNSDLSVSEIGYELGYNEKAYFTRVFTKKTGLNPSEFRQQMQEMLS